jgi:Escherichia/Staphylococcus phage prohead protease
MMDIERRALGLELRLVPGDGAKIGTLSGYAAVYDSLSDELGPRGMKFKERIAPGAFRTAIEALRNGQNIFAYYNHGLVGGQPHLAMPLGSTRDGSLRIGEDARGLTFELDLPDTSESRDLRVLTERGTVRGVSIAWKLGDVKDSWRKEGGVAVRTLHEIRAVVDISPTHDPAYPDTSLAVRSLEAWAKAEEDARAAAAPPAPAPPAGVPNEVNEARLRLSGS